jgi:hypothetical protein
MSSVFSRRVSEAKNQQEADGKQSHFLPVYFLAYSSTMKIETTFPLTVE